MVHDGLQAAQAQVGIKITKRSVRAFLVETEKQYNNILAECSAPVVISVCGEKELVAFQQALKNLFDKTGE